MYFVQCTVIKRSVTSDPEHTHWFAWKGALLLLYKQHIVRNIF